MYILSELKGRVSLINLVQRLDSAHDRYPVSNSIYDLAAVLGYTYNTLLDMLFQSIITTDY